MLITGSPCPNCDGYYFLVPYCKKCGWKDEEWFKEQKRLSEEMMDLFLESIMKDEKHRRILLRKVSDE